MWRRQAFTGTEGELTERIFSVLDQVYNELGFGFLESVYARAMGIALRQSGLGVECEVAVPVFFRAELVGSFRADLVVERKIILELKTAEQISKAHEAQLLHYLRASRLEIGMILNFGESPKARRMEFLNEGKRQGSTAPLVSLPVCSF